jgi:hypothetical protein
MERSLTLLVCQEIPVLNLACPDGQKNFTDFMNRFGKTMPTTFASTSASQTAKVNANKAAALANPPFWYSFEYGMAHIVMVDTETDFKDAPDGKYCALGIRHIDCADHRIQNLVVQRASTVAPSALRTSKLTSSPLT